MEIDTSPFYKTKQIVINDISYIIKYNDTIYSCSSNDIVKDNIINIIFSNSKISNISMAIDIINKYNNTYDIPIICIDDRFNIFKTSYVTKYKLNKDKLYENFNSYYKLSQSDYTKSIDSPKRLSGFILSSKQLYDMLLSEIIYINMNTTYPHYIVCNDDNIMNLSIRFVYTEGELGDKMKKLNDMFGYNYFEIKLNLSSMYPFFPPIISYVRPKIELDLVSNILNLDLWNISSWSNVITLEWIVTNLGKALEPHFNTYVDITCSNNKIDTNPFNFIDIKLLELQTISKIIPSTIIPIDLKVNKYDLVKKSSSSWKSGTGFGSSGDVNWDIMKHIDIESTNEIHIISIYNSINITLRDNIFIDNYIPIQFYKYIEEQFNNINLLYFNKKINLFAILLETLDIIINKGSNDLYYKEFIQSIVNNTNSLYIDINNILTTTPNIDVIIYINFNLIINKYKKLYIVQPEILSIEISQSIENDYKTMVTKYQYDTTILDTTHLYIKHSKDSLSPKSLIRIMSELSSLKKNLPLHWDSSVLMRIIPTNMNLITFLITGPKDTPYHNGLFEFHAYFPDGYPNVVPQVLINTTDNGRVRFNPNLYANGKVCLSLLGTWSGGQGESWIPKLSTLCQVIISIQSLILVDEPYFNEPGYEREIGTKRGIINSKEYNDNIRYETVRVAMLGMLKKPIPAYKMFIEEYFKFKKTEIITTVQKWLDEYTNSDKSKFEKVFDELKSIL